MQSDHEITSRSVEYNVRCWSRPRLARVSSWHKATIIIVQGESLYLTLKRTFRGSLNFGSLADLSYKIHLTALSQ